jgi:hypothetical protein
MSVVRETIRHGGYRDVHEASAPTIRAALLEVMRTSPYRPFVMAEALDAVLPELESGRRGEWGWSTFELLAA